MSQQQVREIAIRIKDYSATYIINYCAKLDISDTDTDRVLYEVEQAQAN